MPNTCSVNFSVVTCISFQGGVKYKVKPDTTVRAKVNSKGVAAACVVQQCASKLSVTVTGQVRLRCCILY